MEPERYDKFQSHSLTLSIFAQGSFLLPLGYIALPEKTVLLLNVLYVCSAV